MHKSDLWIGDRLKIASTGKTGLYDGSNADGSLRIKLVDKLVNVDIQDVVLLGDEEEPSKMILIDELLKPDEGTIKNNHLSHTIDLHIEVLAPEMMSALPDRIRDFQVEACKKFIEQVIVNKLQICHIIHGKGKGVLRSEVLHLLNMYDAFQFYVDASDGGAIDVWFKYHP